MGEQKIGDLVEFGKYQWQILDLQDGKALLVSERILEHRPYHDAYIDITWAESSMRKYLNSDFYDQFSTEEKERILLSNNQNLDMNKYCNDNILLI